MFKNRNIFTILLLLVFNSTFGQVDSNICIKDTLTPTVYLYVDKMPEPKYGKKYLIKSLFEKVKLNDIPKNKVSGSMTIISFVINEKGEIINKKTVREDYSGMEITEQMFKVVESIEWEKGSCKGTPVSVKYILPFKICLK
jgi:hypothetical protein